MVNIKLEAGIIEVKLIYKESISLDEVILIHYPGGWFIDEATVGGERYILTFNSVFKSYTTNRRPSKTKLTALIQRINELINEGNNYYNDILDFKLPNKFEGGNENE